MTNIELDENINVLENIKYIFETKFPDYPIKEKKADHSYFNINFFGHPYYLPYSPYSPYYSRESRRNYHKESNLSDIIFLCLSLMCIIIFSIFIFFNDDYIIFRFSKLNKNFKKIQFSHPELFSEYKKWKKLFVKRVFYKFINKLCIYFSVIFLIIFWSMDSYFALLPLLTLMISIIVYVSYFVIYLSIKTTGKREHCRYFKEYICYYSIENYINSILNSKNSDK